MKVLLTTILFFTVTILVPVSLCAQQKDTTSGEHIFSSNCAACHGSDGRGGERAPDIATVRSVISLTDVDIEGIVKNGIPSAGMPPFGYMGDQKITDVVAFLRVLQGKTAMQKIAGDPRAGRALFYGKAECSRCHMVNGEGGYIATDLSTYGAGVSAANLRHVILDPNQDLEPTGKIVEVRTLSGQSVSGLWRDEDNFTLTLQTDDGRFHMYSKKNLASVRHTSHSMMPTDYESRLSSKEREDVVSFLITTASNAPPTEHSARRRHNDDD